MAQLDEDELIELDLLRSLEIDELVSCGLLSENLRFEHSLLSVLQFTYPEVILQIQTGSDYPAKQLSFGIENLALSRITFDTLRIELRKIAQCDAETNNYTKWSEREEGEPFHSEMTALHLLQKTVETLKSLRRSSSPTSSLSPLKYKNDLIPTAGNINNATLNDRALEVLQQTPEQLCSQIPPRVRVLHVENVLRDDAYISFIHARNRMRERIKTYVSTQEIETHVVRRPGLAFPNRQRMERTEMIEHLVTPKVTFHGTSNSLIPSIVRYGFLRDGDFHPETGTVLNARCGKTYGRGVYSSPSVDFALSYSGTGARPSQPNGFWGLKIIVCATLMGVPKEVTRADGWRDFNTVYKNFDSHTANRDLEYIVFDCAQILPVYVIHLDWGEDNRKFFEDVPNDPANWVVKVHPKLQTQVLSPGDLQRAKEALIAKAAKYFPYGYGPATGGRFVVEEVGEVDEDEENYGEYQIARMGEETHNSVWEWDAAELRRDDNDEYSDAVFGARKYVKRGPRVADDGDDD